VPSRVSSGSTVDKAASIGLESILETSHWPHVFHVFPEVIEFHVLAAFLDAVLIFLSGEWVDQVEERIMDFLLAIFACLSMFDAWRLNMGKESICQMSGPLT